MSDGNGSDANRIQLLLALLAEQGDEIRFRVQSEIAYTAAAIASFGATTWGIATVANISGPGRVLTVLAAAVGVALLAVAVSLRILGDHRRIEAARMARAAISEQLEALTGSNDILPAELLDRDVGHGHRSSIWIVAIAAFGTILFCAAILWTHGR